MVATAPPVGTSTSVQGGLRPLTRRVPYGNTGIEVSRLCWGTGLMAHLRHNMSEEEAARILWRGLDLGVNFWDTADGYKTHPHVRRALQRVSRGDVVISTKTKAKSREDAIADVDRFLQEMGTDVLDTVLLHGIETVEELSRREDALAALHRAKEKGKIRGIGISTHLGTG
ncbi:MAG TPA: aldo/keto reductase, partial [Chloroflexota bacterium]|nr:aldo/keto reductase [Chloroflexota bacterium]